MTKIIHVVRKWKVIKEGFTKEMVLENDGMESGRQKLRRKPHVTFLFLECGL